jgi:hypothetical protein
MFKRAADAIGDLSARMRWDDDDGALAVAAEREAPRVVVERADGSTHTIRVIDAQHPKRLAKPAGVEGYEIYFKIGGAAPASTDECEYLGLLRRSRVVVPLPPGSVGKQAWYIAVPVNTRQQRGPMSDTACAPIAA